MGGKRNQFDPLFVEYFRIEWNKARKRLLGEKRWEELQGLEKIYKEMGNKRV